MLGFPVFMPFLYLFTCCIRYTWAILPSIKLAVLTPHSMQTRCSDCYDCTSVTDYALSDQQVWAHTMSLCAIQYTGEAAIALCVGVLTAEMRVGTQSQFQFCLVLFHWLSYQHACVWVSECLVCLCEEKKKVQLHKAVPYQGARRNDKQNKNLKFCIRGIYKH